MKLSNFSNTPIQFVPLSRCSINKRSFTKFMRAALSCGTTIIKESSANRVFANLFFFFTSSRKYNGTDRSTKDF